MQTCLVIDANKSFTVLKIMLEELWRGMSLKEIRCEVPSKREKVAKHGNTGVCNA